MEPTLPQLIGTVLFGTAVLHTFLVSRFERIASRYPEGSVGENFFHFLGEVEVVFGIWAGIALAAMAILISPSETIAYAESLNFTEPMFVFAIMAVAATRPVISAARGAMFGIARIVPLPASVAIYVVTLVMGPILGSFITEPAAMTVTALILRDLYFGPTRSARFKYVTLATLFVNVSIGGVLTHFAAPPVLMVAGKWGWGVSHMFSHFGWKAVIAVIVNVVAATLSVRKELLVPGAADAAARPPVAPAWLTMLHFVFLALIVSTAHHPVIFMGLFLFFMGVAAITREHQDELKLRESLLVAFFLGGLVIFGGWQTWWLAPLIRGLDAQPLFVGTAALTAITDNAAITYLGSQIEGVSDTFKYALVAGAVAGGGLTVIANAPNPAGFSILQEKFGAEGISPIRLLLAAIVPTLVAMAALWFLP